MLRKFAPVHRGAKAIRRAVSRMTPAIAQISPKLREAIGRGGVAVLWGGNPEGRNSMLEAL
jgi:hypothetical protein